MNQHLLHRQSRHENSPASSLGSSTAAVRHQVTFVLSVVHAMVPVAVHDYLTVRHLAER